jgi:hypothetical protein
MRRALPLLTLLLLFVPPLHAQKPVELQRSKCEYYPLEVGSRWIYRSGMQKVVVTVDREEPFIYKQRDAGDKNKENRYSAPSYWLKITSGDKVMAEQVVVLGENVYRVVGGGKTINPPLCILKLPLKPGEFWECNTLTDSGTLKDAYDTPGMELRKGDGTPIEGTLLKGRFVGGQASFKFKGSDLPALTITSNDFQIGNKTMETETWYAKGLGMIKQRVRVGNVQTTLELEEYLPAK